MLTLVCGRSRAGKTTYCERYRSVLHLDSYGLHPFSSSRLLEKIEHADGDIVVDGIFDKAERRRALLYAYKGGGPYICIWLDTPLDVIESRFCKGARLPHIFEPPTYAEGWDEIIRTTGENNVN